MKSLNLAVTVLFFSALSVSPVSWSACSKRTIEGKFVGEIFYGSATAERPANSALMLNFNGSGGLQINQMTEWHNRQFKGYGGGGSYGLQSNCVGVAHLNIKSNSRLARRARLNFNVGGTAASPEIIGHYYDKDDESVGRFRLIRSDF